MKILELFIINVCFICFPITLYFIFFKFKNNFKKGEKQLYLEIVIYFTLFLQLSLYFELNNKFDYYLISIPIIISLFFGLTKTSIMLMIINILLINNLSSINLVILIFSYIFYLIIYRIYLKSSKIKYFLINNIVIIQSILIIIDSTFFNKNKNIIIILLFYISLVYFSTYIINKINDVLELYKTLNDIKKDEEIRLSISKISHEIKNPLAIIKGYLEIFDNNKIKDYKPVLLKEINFALDVLQDFKELNELKINKKTFIFNDLLYEIKNDIIPFYNKNISCKIICDEGIKIFADKKRIKQVLINIVKNSIEALNKNGKIYINASTIGNKIVIRVKDTGKGMNKEQLNNLFIPFKTYKKNGTGLGLSLSKEIILKHNGTISYKSKENKYTEAKIILPNNNMDIDSTVVHNK